MSQFSIHSVTTRDKVILFVKGIWVYWLSQRINRGKTLYFSTISREWLLRYCSDRHKFNFEYMNYQKTNNTFSRIYIGAKHQRVNQPKTMPSILCPICKNNKRPTHLHIPGCSMRYSKLQVKHVFHILFCCKRMPFSTESNKERCRKLWPFKHRYIFSLT